MRLIQTIIFRLWYWNSLLTGHPLSTLVQLHVLHIAPRISYPCFYAHAHPHTCTPLQWLLLSLGIEFKIPSLANRSYINWSLLTSLTSYPTNLPLSHSALASQAYRFSWFTNSYKLFLPLGHCTCYFLRLGCLSLHCHMTNSSSLYSDLCSSFTWPHLINLSSLSPPHPLPG